MFVEGLLWLLVIGVALLYGALGSSPGPLPLALLVALSAVATWCPPPVSATGDDRRAAAPSGQPGGCVCSGSGEVAGARSASRSRRAIRVV